MTALRLGIRTIASAAGRRSTVSRRRSPIERRASSKTLLGAVVRSGANGVELVELGGKGAGVKVVVARSRVDEVRIWDGEKRGEEVLCTLVLVVESRDELGVFAACETQKVLVRLAEAGRRVHEQG